MAQGWVGQRCSAFFLCKSAIPVSSVCDTDWQCRAGDTFDFLWALLVISTCNRIDGHLPRSTLILMLFRAVLDWIIGLIPFLGDALDAVYKCNTANVNTLEKYLEKRGQAIIATRDDVQGPANNGRTGGGLGNKQLSQARAGDQTDTVDPTSLRQPQPAKVSKKSKASRVR